MKIRYKFLLSFFLGGALAGSLMTSCEDKCTNCDCEGLFVDKIVSSDSLDTGLGQLTSNTTVVVLGSGLSNIGEAFFLDSKNNRYDIYLNPSYVNDNSIIITLDSDADFKPTDRLVLKSKNGCEIVTNIEKPVPAPAIHRFRSEFVQEGDTLRIAGSAFLPTPTTPVSVFFYTNEQGTDSVEVKSGFAAEGKATVANDSKDPVRIKNDNKELLVVVPKGVVDSKPIRITTEYGSTLSKILFRDNRNVFMDFDTQTKTPVNYHGSLSLDAPADAPAWDAQLLTGGRSDAYSSGKMSNLVFPKPCSGRYSALSYLNLYDFQPDQLFAYLQYKDYQTANNLLGQWQGERIESLVLKFEMLIPEEFPFYDVFYLGFTASKTEMEDPSLVIQAYPWSSTAEWHPRSLFTFDQLKDKDGTPTCDATLLDGEPHSGVPAAWFHPGKIDYDVQPTFVVKEFSKDKAKYDTEGEWLTVTIPLTSKYFNAPVKMRGFKTSEKEVVCNPLYVTDFYNFFFAAEGTFTEELKPDLYYFVAFDNFRIVPEDGGGTKFTRFEGVDASAKYPYSIK